MVEGGRSMKGTERAGCCIVLSWWRSASGGGRRGGGAGGLGLAQRRRGEANAAKTKEEKGEGEKRKVGPFHGCGPANNLIAFHLKNFSKHSKLFYKIKLKGLNFHLNTSNKNPTKPNELSSSFRDLFFTQIKILLQILIQHECNNQILNNIK